MASVLYMVGYAVLILGLVLAAHYLHISTRWIVVGVLVVVGAGIIGVAKRKG